MPKFLFTLLAGVIFTSEVVLAQHKISETQFNSILNNFETIFDPWTKEHHGFGLAATGDWEKEWNPTSAGGSNYWFEFMETWGVHLTGWLARDENMDEDELYFVLCHELGHHAYRVNGDEEREADYFVSKTCFRKIFPNESKRKYKNRVLKSFNRITKFRKNYIKKAGYDYSKKEFYNCRKKVIIQGINDQEFENC